MSRRTATRSKARAAARLAATQALYQHEMEGTALAPLLHEFHQHRLGATIEDAEYAPRRRRLFRRSWSPARWRGSDEIDELIAAKLSNGLELERLDKPMKALLRAATYELLARADTATGTVISEYVDVAKAFYDRARRGSSTACWMRWRRMRRG